MNTSRLMSVEELLSWFEIVAAIAIILGIVTIFFLGKTLFEIKTNSKRIGDIDERNGTLFILQKGSTLLRVNYGTGRIQFENMTYSMYSHRKFATSKGNATKHPAPNSKHITVESKEIRAPYDKYALCNS